MRCHYCQLEMEIHRVRCRHCLCLGPWRRHLPGFGLLMMAIALAAILMAQ